MNCKEVSIIIPWRDIRQIDRNMIAKWVLERYKFLFPDAEIILSDSGDNVFSRARSINLGVEKSKGDYLIITDADYLFSEKMAKDIINKHSWTVSAQQKNYYFFNESITHKILKEDAKFDLKSFVVGKNATASPYPTYGQLMAMPKENFVGFDEEMIGYGWEDNVFYCCMKSIYGKEFRTDNNLYHLFHARPPVSRYMQRSYVNQSYYDTVWKPIENDSEKIKALMKEKGMFFK